MKATQNTPFTPGIAASHSRRSAVVAVVLITFATGCAQMQERTSAPANDRTGASTWALPTSTMRWNEHASDLIAKYQIGQAPAYRTFAYLNLAINNAIVLAAQERRTSDGAAAGAAAAMLTYLFPKEEQALASRLSVETAALGTNGPRADFEAGIEAGRAAATEVIALAKSDRSDLAWSGPLPEGPEKWSSRAQPPRPPLGPRLGEMRTFFLTTGADYRAPPPPSVDSAAFKNALAELRAVSEKRTNEQVRIAQYWETLTGAFGAGLWNDVARRAISAHGLTEAESARALARVNMAGMDAHIACHDSKYVYWVPRPTQADPKITLPIGVPNHPSYPSNHACVSGAVGLVLDGLFPDQGGRFFAMGREAGESRILAGIHYRFDVDEGFVIARKVVARALETDLATSRPFVPQGK